MAVWEHRLQFLTGKCKNYDKLYLGAKSSNFALKFQKWEIFNDKIL